MSEGIHRRSPEPVATINLTRRELHILQRLVGHHLTGGFGRVYDQLHDAAEKNNCLSTTPLPTAPGSLYLQPTVSCNGEGEQFDYE